MAEKILKATHHGKLSLGDLAIDCYVLEGERRVIHKRGMARALGMKSAGGNVFTRTLQRKGLGSEIPQILAEKIENPIVFKPLSGDPGHGYEADILIDICDAIIEARNKGKLSPSQEFLAIQAESIIRSVAKVGIAALVDEATGYQAERERDALHKLLSVYLSEERLKWAKMFPDEFYKQIYRLRGWPFPTGSTKRTPYVGKITNKIVYEKLPPGVLEKLKKLNPRVPETRRRRWKYTQFLSEDIGQPDLRDHLLQVIALMRAAPNWSTFTRLLNRAIPTPGEQLTLDIDKVAEDEDGM
jgi:hypothetical protein